MRLVWNGRGKGSDVTGATQPAQFAQLEGYWQALRPADGALPRRADFDPRGIADMLECCLLLERIASGQVRIRLAGMALCDLLGMDLRGMPLSALMVPEARVALAAHLERVFAGPAIGRYRLEGERGFMRAPCMGDMLVLPLLGQSGRPDRALACLVTDGRAGPAPRRFALAMGGSRPIGGLVARPAPTPVPGMAEAPAPFAGPGRPHLRLVKG
ncbi:PAS domain-containing protein [Gemmobacter sp.]|uniref:PAS domain-containing protein n=1 Tax=Gemmobacter sp. TaxID=1898957 RepID=UPI002AFF4741|nr:PAS domain-containing protein [Gemmobacter sp.]